MMSMMFAIEEQEEFLRNVQLAPESHRCQARVSLLGFDDGSKETLSISENLTSAIQDLLGNYTMYQTSAQNMDSRIVFT
jgi:hypothetical protein